MVKQSHSIGQNRKLTDAMEEVGALEGAPGDCDDIPGLGHLGGRG